MLAQLTSAWPLCLDLPWSLCKVQLSLPVTVSHVRSGRQARRSHHSGGDAVVAWPEEDIDSHLLWQLRSLVAAGPTISKIHCSFGSASRSPISDRCSPSDSGGGKAILPCTKALPTWDIYSYSAQTSGLPWEGPIYTCFSQLIVNNSPLCSQNVPDWLINYKIGLPGKALVSLVASCLTYLLILSSHWSEVQETGKPMDISFLFLPHFRWGITNQPLGGALLCLWSWGRSWVQQGQPSEKLSFSNWRRIPHSTFGRKPLLAPLLETWPDVRSLNLTKPDHQLPALRLKQNELEERDGLDFSQETKVSMVFMLNCLLFRWQAKFWW